MENTVKLFLFALLACHVTAWVNTWDAEFTFTCPHNQALYHVISEHNNKYEDREWDFKCRPLPHSDVTMINCEWSGFVNEYDHPMNYQCPNNGVITGVFSHHDNHFEDRRFKFQCCEVPGYVMSGCFFTSYVNNWDSHMDYALPTGKVMKGWDGYHDNGKEDRKFKFEICDMTPINGVVG